MFGRRQGWRWESSLVRRAAVGYFGADIRWLDRLSWVIYWRVLVPMTRFIERNIGE